MKQSFRKIFGAVSAVFLIGLFVAAVPVRAASTDERIKALAAELEQLKAEQQKVQREQSLMKEDALAARAKLPTFRYRPGRALSIRGADRSWEYRVGGKVSANLSFYPGGVRSLDSGSQSGRTIGPSQGSTVMRHMEFDHYFFFLDGLYHFGVTFNAIDARSKSEIFQIRFSKWSPYYPELRIVAISPRTYSRQTRVSSGTGLALERAPVYDNQFATGSGKGIGLNWGTIPMGPVKITTMNINYLSGNQAWNRKSTSDPLDQKGFAGGIAFGLTSKNKQLAGLQVGITYLNLHEDVNHGGSGANSRLRVRTRGRGNRVSIFEMDMRGRRHYVEPWINWESGPFELGYAFSRTSAGQDYTGDAGGSQFSDARLTTNTIAAGMFVWGPKGFMSGSRRSSGWRVSYTHNRNYFDAGSGFAASNRPRLPSQTLQDSGGGTVTERTSLFRSRFTSMRRWNYIENIIMLRWFEARNMVYSLEYQINSLNKMKGTGRAADARRKLGILESGGTYQAVTLHALWEF